jgi:Sulfotransferase family
LNKPACNNIGPVFVVGMPRSGTTMMSYLLSAHPRLSIAIETKFLSVWLPPETNLNDTDESHLREFYDRFSACEDFVKHRLDREKVWQRALENGGPSYKSILTATCQEYATHSNKARWGEKTPQHYLNVKTLLDWYPDAKVVWMVRDPRGNIASNWAFPDARKRALGNWAWDWKLQMDKLDKWKGDDRVMPVIYEKITAEPEKVLREVCAFLGEDYSPHMVDHPDQTAPLIDTTILTDWSKKHHKAAASPISRESVDKWKSEFTPAQVLEIETVISADMIRWGFSPMSSGARRVVEKIRRKLRT